MLTLKEIIEFIEDKEGHKVIAIKPYSAHPDDKHLWLVLCEIDAPRDKYVTWLYNTDPKPAGNWGHYFSDYEQALLDFGKRTHLMFGKVD